MNTLEKLVDRINTIESKVFDFKKALPVTMDKISNLGFQGQVHQKTLYMAILHQIKCPGNRVHDLTLSEWNQWFHNGKIHKYYEFSPWAWSFWFFNMEKGFIRALVSYNSDYHKRPKDNYGIAHEFLKPNVVVDMYRPMIYETTIQASGYSEIWKNLRRVIEYGKSHLITKDGFDKKVEYDDAPAFGDKPRDEGTLLDPQYKETMRPELITIPVSFNYKRKDMRTDTQFINLINGTSFDQLDYEGDGIVRSFPTIKDMNSYLFSAIDYVNAVPIKSVNKDPHGNLILTRQKIEKLEKHIFTDKYEMHEDDQLTPKKFYKVKVTKFLERVVFEAEVSEFGVYYKISNFNGKDIL